MWCDDGGQNGEEVVDVDDVYFPKWEFKELVSFPHHSKQAKRDEKSLPIEFKAMWINHLLVYNWITGQISIH